MLTMCHSLRASARGFSLIELMVSIFIGMLVALGAVSLIVAIDSANSETIQSARVDQEMRALASVIADEIKRARRLHDPITYVGQGGTTSGTFDTVDTSTAGCILYGYQDATLDSAAANQDFVNNYETIYLSTTGGFGSVIFAKGTSAVSCTTAGTTLNSAQLNVTGLTFACVVVNGSNVVSESTSTTSTLPETCNEIDITLNAKLVNPAGDTFSKAVKSVTHTYVQQVFIRSGAAKTS
jgi:Tfp pilus assembly protein PilV